MNIKTWTAHKKAALRELVCILLYFDISGDIKPKLCMKRKQLPCIQLRWNQRHGDESYLSILKFFGLFLSNVSKHRLQNTQDLDSLYEL